MKDYSHLSDRELANLAVTIVYFLLGKRGVEAMVRAAVEWGR